MENVRGGRGPAKRLTAATPTVRATRTAARSAPPGMRDAALCSSEDMVSEQTPGSMGRWSHPRERDHWYIRRANTSPQEGPVKILFFDDFKLGVLKGDAVVDVSDTVRDIPHTGPHNLISGLIERFADYKRRLEEAVSRGKSVPLGQVKIRPPLPKPTNIECMAVNYMEDGTRSEPAPINAFHKSPSAIIGPEDTMVLP